MMTTYTETINIVVNDADIRTANSALNSLKMSINNLNNRQIRIRGAESFKTVIGEYNKLIRNIGKQTDVGGINNVIKQLNRVQRSMGKGIELRFKEGNLKSIVSGMEKLTSEMKELRSVVKGIDFSNLSKGAGSAKQTETILKQLEQTVKALKANSDITIKVKGQGAQQVQKQLQQTQNTRAVRNQPLYQGYAGRRVNYFGFDAYNSPAFQYGASLKQTSRRMQMMGEKIGLLGANMMMFASYAGVHEVTDMLINTPARAEVQKYLLSNMQGESVTHFQKGNVAGLTKGQEASLYDITDKVTDTLPISMQNVVNPLYALQAATGANAQEMADVIPQVANFGAQVLNMTGSEERAETAMEKLAYGFNGQFQALDQYGISEMALKNHGFDTAKLGNKEYLGEFMDVVTEITGDATKSMNNFNGLKALVGKDFSRSGKKVWNEFLGPLATTGLRAFHETDQALGGIPTTLLTVGSAGLSMATTITTLVGAAGTAIGSFAEMSASLKAVRKNGGGIKGFLQAMRASSFNELNRYGYGGNAGLSSTKGNTIANGHLASIDGKMNAVITGVRTNAASDVAGDVADDIPVGYGRGQMTPAQKRAQERINKKKAKESTVKNTHAPRRVNQGMNLLFGGEGYVMEQTQSKTATRGRNKTERRINKWGKGIRKQIDVTGTLSKTVGKTTSALKGFGSSLLSVMGSNYMLLGVMGAAMVGMAFYNSALKNSPKVAEAHERLTKALDHAKNSAMTQLGNFFQNQGWTKTGGEEGVYEGLAVAIDALTNAIYSLPFVDKPDKYYSDYEKPEEDPDLPEKKEKMRNLDWEHSAVGTFLKGTPLNMFSTMLTGKSLEDNLGIKEYYAGKREEIRKSRPSEERLAKNMEQMNSKLTERNKEIQKEKESRRVSEAQKQGVERQEIAPKVNKEGGSSWFDGLKNWWNTTFGGGNATQNAQQGNPANPQATNPALKQLNLGNMFQGVDFSQMGNQLITQLSQSLQTANLTSLGQGIMNSLNNSLMTMDMTSIGTTLSTQISSSIQNSFANTPIDLSGFFSGITGQISQHNGEFTSAGNTGGSNYKTGFGSGIGGTSGTASAEASEVLSALDIADQAYAKGQAAGKAFHDGFTSSGGDDINSPGRAARAARDEGQYMLGFMNDTISPLYSTAQLMGNAMATGFARTGELSYSGVSLPQVPEQNTATGIFGSGGTSGNTYHLTQNVNIEKVDSRERAKEIAEYTVKMMKWNNETAGRSTEV